MPLRVLGIAGSLRRASFNRSLLAAAVELVPEDMEIRVFEGLGATPLYDADLEAAGEPPPVAALRAAIREADALLFATPEYNHSIPGVLKNAIDWASRPSGRSVMNGKPAGMIGATPGMGATIRGQLALRQALDGVGRVYVLPDPEVLIARAGERFDAAGRLTDEATRKHLERFLVALGAWVRRFTAVS